MKNDSHLKNILKTLKSEMLQLLVPRVSENTRNIWHTHVISEQPDRLWSFATIFSAAAFLAAFFEFPAAVETYDKDCKQSEQHTL